MLITYDVDFSDPKGAKRLRKIAKICERYGVRVQNSVFEMLIEPASLVEIKNQFKSVIDLEKDSIRFYNLGKSWDRKIGIMGNEKGFNQNEALIL